MNIATHEQTTLPAQPTAENWRGFAHCAPGTIIGGAVVDPNIFYPENRFTDEGKLQSEVARLICLGCSAIDFCFQARVNLRDRAGVRGGMTEAEYLAMIRREELKDNERQVSLVEAARLRAAYARPMTRLQRDNLAKKITARQAKEERPPEQQAA